MLYRHDASKSSAKLGKLGVFWGLRLDAERRLNVMSTSHTMYENPRLHSQRLDRIGLHGNPRLDSDVRET